MRRAHTAYTTIPPDADRTEGLFWTEEEYVREGGRRIMSKKAHEQARWKRGGGRRRKDEEGRVRRMRTRKMSIEDGFCESPPAPCLWKEIMWPNVVDMQRKSGRELQENSLDYC